MWSAFYPQILWSDVEHIEISENSVDSDGVTIPGKWSITLTVGRADHYLHKMPSFFAKQHPLSPDSRHIRTFIDCHNLTVKAQDIYDLACDLWHGHEKA